MGTVEKQIQFKCLIILASVNRSSKTRENKSWKTLDDGIFYEIRFIGLDAVVLMRCNFHHSIPLEALTYWKDGHWHSCSKLVKYQSKKEAIAFSMRQNRKNRTNVSWPACRGTAVIFWIRRSSRVWSYRCFYVSLRLFSDPPLTAAEKIQIWRSCLANWPLHTVVRVTTALVQLFDYHFTGHTILAFVVWLLMFASFFEDNLDPKMGDRAFPPYSKVLISSAP